MLNARLHEMLGVIGAPAPYVLVAHSWASWAVRGYSAKYPDEVAGLVLIVAPDGTVRYLTEGMLRALHREVADEPPPSKVMALAARV